MVMLEAGAPSHRSEGSFQTKITTVMLGVFLPSLALMSRRLHDTNRSAWWLLLTIVPVVGVITLIVFLCQRSEPGNRQFT